MFTVIACGFWPRTALEINDGGIVRLDKIIRLIKESRLSIHDLSAVKLDKVNKLPRFNMPFELGLVMGGRKLGGNQFVQRPLLILECEKYTYQKCLSDIAGQDTHSHNGSPKKLISIIRNWLNQISTHQTIPGEKKITSAYASFVSQLPSMCRELGVSHKEMSYGDLLGLSQEWLKRRP